MLTYLNPCPEHFAPNYLFTMFTRLKIQLQRFRPKSNPSKVKRQDEQTEALLPPQNEVAEADVARESEDLEAARKEERRQAQLDEMSVKAFARGQRREGGEGSGRGEEGNTRGGDKRKAGYRGGDEFLVPLS